MNERDEPMKGLAEWLPQAARLRSLLPPGYNPNWPAEVEASRQRSAVGTQVVAWMRPDGLGVMTDDEKKLYETTPSELSKYIASEYTTPLYPAPPSERPAAPAQEAAGAQAVQQTIIAHGLTVCAGMPLLKLVERLAELMAENADLRAAPAQAGVTDAQIRAGIEAANAMDSAFDFGDGSTADEREADCIAAFREAAQLAGTPPAQSEGGT